MNTKKLEKMYGLAKERYAELGINEAVHNQALSQLASGPVEGVASPQGSQRALARRFGVLRDSPRYRVL